MEYNNKFMELAKKYGAVDKETLKTFVILVAPFAPHIGEELYEALGFSGSVFHDKWPEFDESKMKDDVIEVPVQVNGKTKLVISLDAEISKEAAIKAGLEALREAGKLEGDVIKEIYIPKKIINIVVK